MQTREAAEQTRRWSLVAAAALCWGVIVMIALHLVGSQNPLLSPLSRYVLIDPGADLLATSMLSTAVGSVALLGAMRAAGLPLNRTAVALFACWASGLALAAVFPASYPEDPAPISGHIHQSASLVAFLALPAAGKAVCDSLRGVPGFAPRLAALRRLTVAAVLALVVFGVTYVSSKMPGEPGPVGIAQRIALLADIALLGGFFGLLRVPGEARRTAGART
jgi:hypothetical protein